MIRVYSYCLYRAGVAAAVVLLCLSLFALQSGVAPASAQIPAVVPGRKVSTLPSATASTVEEIRKGAEKACGVLADYGSWQLQGSTQFRGAEVRYEMRFDSHFRFRRTLTGALSHSDAFDGSVCWTEGPDARPHRLILRDRDINRLFAWTVTGAWALKSAPLLREMATNDPGSDGKRTITLKPLDGQVVGTLTLDASTLLPETLRYGTNGREAIWTFSNYKSFHGRLFPTRILEGSGERAPIVEIVSANRVKDEATHYKLAKTEALDVEFEATTDNTVEIKRVQELMFVHPKIDGQDVGWFLLDTGAECLCIDTGLAKKLGMLVVGGVTVDGIVGEAQVDICRARTFQLGPMTQRKPVFLKTDLEPLSQLLKFPIAGVCGYDFFARTSLMIDLPTGRMQIFPPGVVPLPVGFKWTPFGFDANTPCLECTFAQNNKGIFGLDTGSDSTVDFFTPAVEKFHLPDNQQTTQGTSRGLGGSAEKRDGKIDWFKLGNVTFENPPVSFQLTKSGSFASPYRTGNIGMSFLGGFRLLFWDYANERLAFARRNGLRFLKTSLTETGRMPCLCWSAE